MKEFIVKRWTSIIVSLTTVAYGLQLFITPTIFENYRPYQIINEIVDYRIVSGVFIVIGILNLVGMIRKIKKLKRFCLASLSGLWTLFGLSFVFSNTPNTVWLTSLALAWIVIGIAMKEEA